MELTLTRYKHTADYTLSRLTYENLLSLDIVEPPVEGLNQQPFSTLLKGIYKLYLKPRSHELSVVPRFQKAPNKPFFFILPTEVEFDIQKAKFNNSDDYAPMFCFWSGKINGTNFAPAPNMYERLITLMCIALKRKEIVTVNIK